MALEQELETYKRLLPVLLSDEGRFALIAEDQFLGTFAAYEDALKAGYSNRGMRPFLVKLISGNEQVSYFSRDVQQTCSA